MSLSRRTLLASAAGYVAAGITVVNARVISGSMPWQPGAAEPPTPWRPGRWLFFTTDEAAVIEAAVDRLIPPDERGAGGKDAGCAIFIDRQLAGPYGRAAGLYMRPPFMPGAVTQGNQNPETPAARYRGALKALADYLHESFGGKTFGELSPEQQDEVLAGLEGGKIELRGAASAEFFNLLLQNTQEGFFGDPVYGGNRDMAGWKLVGFPGTRYDYRDWVERHNEPYPLPPLSIMGRPAWNVRE